MSEIVRLKIKDIENESSVKRLDFYDESIIRLAESIKNDGLLTPITVYRKDNGKYELVMGERRLRASKYLEYEEIDAIVLSEKNKEESSRLALIENLQRQDLNAIDVARGMQKIMDEENITQAELARRLGYKQSTVANKIRLLRLPEYVQSAIIDGTITERHARALLKVDEDKIEDVFLVIVNRKYNVAKSEEYIKSLGNKSHIKGVGASAAIALNTFKKTYEDCKKVGIDIDLNTREYDDYVKSEIKIKK